MAAARARHRGHGEGSLYQRKDGRWAATLTYEDETGRHRRKTYYGRTRQEVKDALKAAQHHQHEGSLQTGKRQKLGSYLEEWLRTTHKYAVKPQTWEKSRNVIERHVIPALGHLPLEKLTPQHIQAFYTQKIEAGYAPSMVRQIHVKLNLALTHAVSTGLLRSNPATHTTKPQVTKYEATALTEDQARHLLETARGQHVELAVALALLTGMREGEILALTWEDINRQARTISITKTSTYTPERGAFLSEPKTRASRRTITYAPALDAIFERHPGAQSGLLYPNKAGELLRSGVFHRYWKKLLGEAGLPASMHFHDLRHSAATLLAKQGVHPSVVQSILGHSHVSMTLDIYTKTLPGQQEAALERLGKLLGE